MPNIGYLLRRIRKMDYKSMFDTLKAVRKKSKKNSIILFCDMTYCGLKYGAAPMDYYLNEWWNLNSSQRKTYITRGKNDALVKRLNKPESFYMLDDKVCFNKLFSNELGRKWIYLKEATVKEFAEFLDSVGDIIVKPLNLCCGEGIRKIEKGSYSSAEELYKELIESEAFLVEEFVIQHSEIAKFYPLSVNTLRIVTLASEDGVPHILYAFIKMGNHGNVVDNINAGGMAAPIDLETGVINGVAFDRDYFYYDAHPYTGTPIVGFKIPMWDEACKLVIDAAKKIPDIRYIAWDVALTEDKPTFIEGNQHPGYGFLQMPPHVPDKIGILPRFAEFIDL